MSLSDINQADIGYSDEILLETIRSGSVAAYAILYARYHDGIFKLVERTLMARDFAETQDIVEEVFANVYSAIRSGNGPIDNFRGYLVTVARNESRKHNKRYFSQPLLVEPATFSEGHQKGDFNEEDSRIFIEKNRVVESGTILFQAFSGLTPEEAYILWRRIVEGVTNREMANELGVSSRNFASQFDKIKGKFRSKYFYLYSREVSDPECKLMIPIYHRYVDNKSTPAQTQRVERHLAHCESCAKAIRGLVDQSSEYWMPLIFGVGLSQKILEIGTGPVGSGISALTKSGGSHALLKTKGKSSKNIFQGVPSGAVIAAAIVVSVVGVIAGLQIFGPSHKNDSVTIGNKSLDSSVQIEDNVDADTAGAANSLMVVPAVDSSNELSLENVGGANQNQQELFYNAVQTIPNVPIIYDLEAQVTLEPRPFSTIAPTIVYVKIINNGPNDLDVRGTDSFISVTISTTIPVDLTQANQRDWTCNQIDVESTTCIYRGFIRIGAHGVETLAFPIAALPRIYASSVFHIRAYVNKENTTENMPLWVDQNTTNNNFLLDGVIE